MLDDSEQFALSSFSLQSHRSSRGAPMSSDANPWWADQPKAGPEPAPWWVTPPAPTAVTTPPPQPSAPPAPLPAPASRPLLWGLAAGGSAALVGLCVLL